MCVDLSRLFPWLLVVAALQAAGAPPLLAQESAGPAPKPASDERIHGFDVETLAKATVQATAFSSEYGLAQGEKSFELWLRSQGLSLREYDAAYEAYLKHFANNKSLEQSFFAALDRYAPEPATKPQNQTEAGLQALDARGTIDQAYRGSGQVGSESSGSAAMDELDPESQREQVFAILAASQSLANTSVLAEQEVVAQKYGEQLANLRRGTLPKAEDEPYVPLAEPLPPAEPETLAKLDAALASAHAPTRQAAARPFAWECDSLSLLKAEEREQDPRTLFCQPAALRLQWLPVALEIFDQAPEDRLELVAGVLDYLKPFGFEAESQQALEALARRLKSAITSAESRLAKPQTLGTPEQILLKKRLRDLKSTLEAIERALVS